MAEKENCIRVQGEIGLQREHSINSILPEITYSDIVALSGESDADKVYTLDLHGHKINNISHMDKLTHLRCLDASCNHLDKIDGLENNTFLCELKLYSNTITHISGLKGLKNLVQLSLQMNRIRDVGKGLKSLSKLEILRLDMNLITQIDANTNVEGCSSLMDINLANNAIDSVKNFRSTHKLEKLDLSYNNLSSIQGLNNCNSLIELNLTGNNITGLFEVPSLKSIQILTISNNNIKEIRVGNQCKHLTELYANDNRLNCLPNNMKIMFPNLQRLELKSNEISNLNNICCAIKECQNLNILLLENNPIGLSMSEISDKIKAVAHNVSECTDFKPNSSELRIEEVKIETTFKEIAYEMKNYEDLIQSTIEDIQTKLSCDDLPNTSVRPKSRCHSRARINEALEFASKHFNI
ncbi:Protein phosphatase 1 regulatory subunit 7-like [Oopsacas minuta]|uniref:Protein phosphatase 1 regulatory subunit 7-like n=1 Tax=Oopsacas minuta TaxID=111878 RepID=A0AAV7JAX6_9METZ|nr:Protein phosphatase 1 regulatory subunit 7-like [Oopsacas minuta]